MDSSYRQIDWNADGGRTPFANALSVLAGVVSRPLSDRAVLDVGWKAASSDSGPPVLKEGGYAVEFAGDEHSLVRGEIASTLRVGSRVELIPSHCDTTVNLYDRYHVIRDGAVEAIWPVAARGRTD
jgi:D-serine deaminase-like pyridoxal phosphate-dependent protein